MRVGSKLQALLASSCRVFLTGVEKEKVRMALTTAWKDCGTGEGAACMGTQACE